MGMFDQIKMAQEMMKNMTPEQIQEIMKMAPQLAAQTKNNERDMEDMVRRIVAEEIEKRGLVSRSELGKI